MAIPFYSVVWGLLVYAWISNYMIRMALSSLLPPIMAELDLSYTKAGFLATAFFYAYMAMQIPAGLLGDRFGRTRIIVIGIAVGIAASVMTGLAGSFLILFLARLLTGVGHGSLYSNDRVLVAAYTPKEKMALGQGVSFSGPGVGTTLGLILAGVLGEVMPWRSVFFVFALPPLIAAALLVWAIPDPQRLRPAEAPDRPFRRVFATRDLWLLGIAGIMPAYVEFVLSIWGPLLFAEIGVKELGRSAFYASLQGLAAPFALVSVGWLSDRMARQGIGRKAVAAISIFLMGLSVAAMGLVVQGKGAPWLLMTFLVLTSFFAWGTWAPCFALLAEMFPPSVLGAAFGLYNTICFVGALIGPLFTGWLKDVTGSFAWGCYGAALAALLGAVVAMAIRPAFRFSHVPPDGVQGGQRV
jgi:MFS family permease